MFFSAFLVSWFVVAGAILVALCFVTAPYGRHSRQGWGAALPSRYGWLLMEAVSPAAIWAFYLLHPDPWQPAPLVMVGLWTAHYVHRAFIYPFHEKRSRRNMPVLVVILAVFFNTGNGYINGTHLGSASPAYPVSWLYDPRFLVGLGVFVAGFVINRHSDNVLMRLRPVGGGTGGAEDYLIPREGLFRYVSSANYLGGIIEWVGWAVMTWSLAGLSFAVWTACNLIPRGWANHKWYLRTFPDYPEKRKAIIPLLF